MLHNELIGMMSQLGAMLQTLGFVAMIIGPAAGLVVAGLRIGGK